MTQRLEGKVALITGTGGGQGRAAALLFAKEGARVIGCDWNVKGAEETRKMVEDSGGVMVSMQPVDLGDGDQMKQWLDFAIKTFKQIDILYNNASSPKFAPIDRMTEEEWHFTLRNELDLIYWACHYSWPHLKATGNSTIINTASTAGIVGFEADIFGNFAHSAAKGGVIALTRQLAIEGAPYGIRVNSISPGIIMVPATEPLFQNPEFKKAMLEMVPLHRIGKAEEIAHVALFLASDEASYVTGANIVVDGGLTAR
jgi:meso-butanediol dehydrogenase/(S,S)-butanediol dehydrogenase/diacetyl reductase